MAGNTKQFPGTGHFFERLRLPSPQLYFPGLEVGSTTGNNARPLNAVPARGSAGRGGAGLSVDQQRAQGPRPAESAPKFLILQPAHSPRPLPPQPSTPAAPGTLSSLQRGQTIFPYESSHSLPDRFHILGSKLPAKRPRPIFDVLSAYPAPRPHISPVILHSARSGLPPVSTPAALHPSLSPPAAFICSPHPGCTAFSPTARRKSPPHLPALRVSGASRFSV